MMQEPVDVQMNSDNPHWLSVVETLSLLGAIGGTVASVVTQQVAYASIPLSLTATLNLLNRRRLMDTLTQERQDAIAVLTTSHREQGASLTDAISQIEAIQQSVSDFKGEHKQSETTLSEQLQEHQKLISENQEVISGLKRDDQVLNGAIHNLGEQQQELSELVETLKVFSISSGSIEAHTHPGEAHYNRGISQERLGALEEALADYTEAIGQNPDYAEAYFSRGQLKSQLGDKQEAVEDLRLAAKCFFERGDLANYQKAKDMIQQTHGLGAGDLGSDEPEEDKAAETVLVEGLFG